MNENEAQQVMNFCPKGLKVFMTMCTPNPTWKNIGQLTTTLEFINIKTEIKSWINIHVIGNVVIIVLHCPRTAIKFFFFLQFIQMEHEIFHDRWIGQQISFCQKNPSIFLYYQKIFYNSPQYYYLYVTCIISVWLIQIFTRLPSLLPIKYQK